MLGLCQSGVAVWGGAHVGTGALGVQSLSHSTEQVGVSAQLLQGDGISTLTANKFSPPPLYNSPHPGMLGLLQSGVAVWCGAHVGTSTATSSSWDSIVLTGVMLAGVSASMLQCGDWVGVNCFC